MENELGAESTSTPSMLYEKPSEIAGGCEEVLLPEMANGTVTEGDNGIDFFENEPILPDNDPMEDINDYSEVIDEELEEEEEIPIERTPTQVPKKRKDAALFAAVAQSEEQSEKEEKDTIKEEIYEEEQPTSSARAANKEDTVDEEQCRVCTTKVDLVSLFKTIEHLNVAEMLMTICPSVSIAPKDFMPQYICNPCLDNVTIAVQLKTQCETTEKELRKKLSRGKNKVRRPTGYVVIDAPVESEPSEEEEPNDEEYKVSDEASISLDDDSDDSDYSNKKKRIRGTGSKRGRRKSAVTPTLKSRKKSFNRNQLKRSADDSSDDDGLKKRRDEFAEDGYSSEEDDEQSPKKKRNSGGGKDFRIAEFPCDLCDQVFTRKASLVLHKKGHAGGREPINCEICGKQFKIQGAYRTHLEKHKESANFDCNKCDKIFTSKSELRQHQVERHDNSTNLHQCLKCKRTFVSEARLRRHKDGRCPAMQPKQKRNDLEGYAIGKDLFKSVAPLTTTYWSDSFSD